MPIRVLILGDVVGRPGREAVRRIVPRQRELGAQIVIVNGENAASGSGLTPKILKSFFELGVDVVTAGDHVYKNKEIDSVIREEKRLIRPNNYGQGAAGFGYGVFESAGGVTFGVTLVVGRIFMGPANCPFQAADHALDQMRAHTPVLLVEAHCEATSEALALGWHLDGRASCVYGTHTHVATTDAELLLDGTAYVTDLGMTGPHDGIIGRNKGRVLRHMLSQMPVRFDVAGGDVRANGILVDIDTKTGRALTIKRFEERL